MAKKEKTKKDFEVWANKELKKMQDILKLNNYQLLPIQHQDEEYSSAVLRYPYKDIQISYGNAIFREWQKGDKNREAWNTLLHEMIHSLTDRMYYVGYQRFTTELELRNVMEELTDNLTTVISDLVHGRYRN